MYVFNPCVRFLFRTSTLTYLIIVFFVDVNESPICFNLFNHYYMLKLFWFWVKTNKTSSRHLIVELVCFAIRCFCSQCITLLPLGVFCKGKIISFNNLTCAILFRFVLCSKRIIVPNCKSPKPVFSSRQNYSASLMGVFSSVWTAGWARGHLLVSWWSTCFDFPSLKLFVYLYAYWIGLSAVWRPVCASGNDVIVGYERQNTKTHGP